MDIKSTPSPRLPKDVNSQHLQRRGSFLSKVGGIFSSLFAMAPNRFPLPLPHPLKADDPTHRTPPPPTPYNKKILESTWNHFLFSLSLYIPYNVHHPLDSFVVMYIYCVRGICTGHNKGFLCVWFSFFLHFFVVLWRRWVSKPGLIHLGDLICVRDGLYCGGRGWVVFCTTMSNCQLRFGISSETVFMKLVLKGKQAAALLR